MTKFSEIKWIQMLDIFGDNQPKKDDEKSNKTIASGQLVPLIATHD